MMSTGAFDRVLWIVLDSVGVGELPDADQYGDRGANTLASLARAFRERTGRSLRVPGLERLGIGNVTHVEGVPPRAPGDGEGACGRAIEQSAGKDTTTGHWELAGLILRDPFPVFPRGFPQEVVDRWARENGLPGVLGNKPASGTEIIVELGEEHLRTGKPILYTSADSVWQVAAHEEAFGLERLYAVCRSARRICDELGVGRVIARPFVGNPATGRPFTRTHHRHDFSLKPPGPTYLDALQAAGIDVLAIGKISSIFAGQGVTGSIETEGNTHGVQIILDSMRSRRPGLIFCNLLDFDMLYGHRRDVAGYAHALEEFDLALPGIQALMGPRDLLVLTADHGNDPTHGGTDHTREYVPVLAFTPAQQRPGPIDLGTRSSFADIGATVTQALLGSEGTPPGAQSFLSALLGA
ncbi:MAG: phosphopentomutase [Acidobacteriota bacterium]